MISFDFTMASDLRVCGKNVLRQTTALLDQSCMTRARSWNISTPDEEIRPQTSHSICFKLVKAALSIIERKSISSRSGEIIPRFRIQT